jgi:hypothetical protein
MKITTKRWDEAQKAERECHDRFIEKAGIEGVKARYNEGYASYFRYLGLTPDQSGKTITEIGCADFPALQLCDVEKGYLVEPLPSTILEEVVENNDSLELIQSKVEDIDLPKSDEIWLLNVLQHVLDPDLFIKKCKKATKVIRFFEPIDWPIEIYHPHTFTEEDFRGWFGGSVVRYEGTEPNFHQAHCAYGVWTK